jgi:hypothetical protein
MAGQLSQHMISLRHEGQDNLVKGKPLPFFFFQEKNWTLNHLMLADDFNVSVVNVIWKMVANKTFALDSQVFIFSFCVF